MKPKTLFLFVLTVLFGIGIAVTAYRAIFKFRMPLASDSELLIPRPIKTRSTLPEFTLLDLDGNPQSSTQWKGKILVLNFWATWCPPCRKEIPDFINLQNELRNRGLQFVGIAIDDPAAVRDFATVVKFNYPVLLGDNRALRLSAKLGNRLQGLPFSVIFDPNGRVLHRKMGELTSEIIRAKVEPLLETPNTLNNQTPSH